jgi:dihydroorotase
VRNAKRRGLNVTCEVAPHHFTLTDAAIGDYNTHAKMYPPLRAAQDRDAMIEGLLDGTVDCIATDHAPHAIHEKQQEFERAPNGILGLETALALAIRVLYQQHGMALPRALALLSSNPAKITGMDRQRGHLRGGATGGAVIFAPEKMWTYRASNSPSLSRNTPFDGWKLPCEIFAVVYRGEIYRGNPN